ncbi:MAG TPA: transcriptional repressor LexA [Fimbriimonadaceae bacterium]|nr:hypothetical protein [Armatimonadota bacterium]HRD31776.1 transcriptional repressor LexA [Fimbriimonadaceae bacterium]HRE93093.1 transcriptional repressor LexA [Fimbriimonadaceae bacterium]HRI74063.1 transcriptional repressor LexA [Fimbriimonadaceae bacterium]
MAKGLTERQRDILAFLADYTRSVGYPPSIREIGDKFGIGSLRGVTVHLDALEKKGAIGRENTPRSIRILHPDYQSVVAPEVHFRTLPLLGEIAAGAPITAEAHIEEYLPVPSSMLKGSTEAFLLRVKGDSMIEEGIFERDLVVVRRQDDARNGDLVAAMVEGEATVKRIKFQRPDIHLIPANPAYREQIYPSESVSIVGRVIGLLRTYA